MSIDGASEELLRYRSLFDRHPDAVFELDLDGRFVSVNAAMEQLVGYSADELIGTTWLPLVAEDGAEQSADEFARARRGEARTFDGRGLTRDGRAFDVHMTSLPIVVDGEVVGVHAIARDVTEERAGREQLEDSEARFRSIFEASEPGMLFLDLEGRYLQANQAFCAMVGFTELELQAIDVWTLMHRDDKKGAITTSIDLVEGRQRTAVYEARYHHKHGHVVWLKASVSMVRWPSGEARHSIASVEDITSRKEAEQRARRGEAMLKMAGSVARFGGWSIDVATDENHWSEEMHEILEFPIGETPGVDEVIALFPELHRQRVAAALERCMGDGSPFDLDLEILTARGRLLPVRIIGEAERDEQGRIVTVRGAFQDISARQQVTARNRRLTQQLSRTLEAISDGVATIEPDWTISYGNLQAERYLGRSREELVGRHLLTAYPELEGSSLHAMYRRAMDDGVTGSSGAFFVASVECWFDVTAYPAYPGIVIFFQDVTERVERERRLEEILGAEQQAAERLREADRVKTTFLTAVSHELRTPLTVVQGMAQTLQRLHVVDDPATRRRAVDALVDHSQRLSSLLDELLDLDRLGRGTLATERDSCDVAALAREAVRSSPARSSIELRTPHRLMAEVDRVQIERILGNLIDNAVKYAPDSPIQVRLTDGPDELRIEVLDKGPGIPDHQLTRVFEPFARAGDLGAKPGTGIGLALVAAFAELHGGRAWAEPHPHGAHLVVAIPGVRPSA